MPEVYEGNILPDPSVKPEPTSDVPTTDDPAPGPVTIETAYARGVGSSADIDGTHHDGTPPGEGEGTGIGSSSDSSGTPN